MKKQAIAEADKWFSLYIRERDKACVLAGDCAGPLQCGHLFPRSRYATRWSPEAAFCQCERHNNLHEENPEPFKAWFIANYGREKYDILEYTSRRPMILKEYAIRELAERFRAELLSIREQEDIQPRV